MNDMSSAIIPKSDQLNADDLIAGPRTIRITSVTIRSVPDQPVSVFFEGDNGRPYKPCKSMCKVMVAAWGQDAKQYTGRSMTIYRDQTVKWGGMEVGGIRISHMSHIERDMVVSILETRGKKRPYIVKMLAVKEPAKVSQEPAAEPAKQADTFTLAGIIGPAFPKTKRGITEAIEALEAAEPDVVADNAEWLATMAEKVPALSDRINALLGAQ